VLQEQNQAVNIASLPGVEFKHPIDLGDLTAVNCSDCHTGGVSP
jgi:acyl-CoA hydrolase